MTKALQLNGFVLKIYSLKLFTNKGFRSFADVDFLYCVKSIIIPLNDDETVSD